MKELLELQVKARALKQEDYPDFHSWWQAKFAIEYPILQWAQKIINGEFYKRSCFTNHHIFMWIYSNDINCSKIPVEKSGILRDDDEIYAFAILDYDCDTTLCKWTVKHKPSGLAYSHAIDLGRKYCQYGIQIEIGPDHE